MFKIHEMQIYGTYSEKLNETCKVDVVNQYYYYQLCCMQGTLCGEINHAEHIVELAICICIK